MIRSVFSTRLRRYSLVLYACLAFCTTPIRTVYSDTSSTEQKAQALLTLSSKQNETDHLLALKTAQQAAALFEAEGNKEGQAAASYKIGQYYLAQNDLDEATASYLRSLEIRREQNDTQNQAKALISLGYVESRRAEWSKAIAYLVQAQNVLGDAGSAEDLGRIEGGLGDTFNDSGLPESGLIHFKKALDYFRQTTDDRDDKRMLLSIGDTYRMLGRYDEALRYLTEALNSFDPGSLDAAQCHEFLAQLHLATRNEAVAFEHVQRALSIFQNTHNPREVAALTALMGLLYENQGQISKARNYYFRAATSFSKLSDRLNLGSVYFALGRLEMRAKNFGLAKKFLEQSIQETEDVWRVASSRDLTASFSSTVRVRYAAYIECLMEDYRKTHSSVSLTKTFELSELARARSLADFLRATQTDITSDVDPQLAKREKQLRESLRVKDDTKIMLLARGASINELQSAEASRVELRKDYEAVVNQIRDKNPAHDLIIHPSVFTLRQVQDEVVADGDTTLLEYSLGEEASYVWVVTKTDVRAFTLANEATINDAVSHLYTQLSTRPGNEPTTVEEFQRKLSDLVLAPLNGQLAGHRLVIVPDGSLNYIPFQSLVYNNQSLIQNYEVINAPSASVLAQLRHERMSRQVHEHTLAAFGDSVFATNLAQFANANSSGAATAARQGEENLWQHAWRDVELKEDTLDPVVVQPLFYSKVELANLSSLAGDQALMATGFDSSRDTLQGTDLSKYSILHLATHGFFDPKRPERSGLLLSIYDRSLHPINGFVSIQDIYNLRAPVDLVVLSACRTGLGKDVRGEGLIGLTRGFMHAGASSVVATLWKVDDEATAELMKRFYTNMLRNGMTPAAALRLAQNEIRSDPRWNSPYYWAAFTIQGDYQQNIRTSVRGAVLPWAKIGIAGIALLLLLGSFLYLRARIAALPNRTTR